MSKPKRAVPHDLLVERLIELERRVERLEMIQRAPAIRPGPVDLQTGRSRSPAAVREGWRRCRKTVATPHLWNTQTLALNTVEHPRDLRHVPFEDCPSHRSKR